MPAAGYSGTPLAKKLGLAPGMRWLVRHAPKDYAEWLAPIPDGCTLVARAATPAHVHTFHVRRADLEKELAALRGTLAEDGFVWVSWPKKSAKVPTDITEDVIRAVALPLGFVDVKVCAVSETWSGLKLVIRVSERGTKAR